MESFRNKPLSLTLPPSTHLLQLLQTQLQRCCRCTVLARCRHRVAVLRLLLLLRRYLGVSRCQMLPQGRQLSLQAILLALHGLNLALVLGCRLQAGEQRRGGG